MRSLHELGYPLSTGPLSDLDADAHTARQLGVPVAIVPSGSTPSVGVLAAARELLGAARGVILTPFAVGPGNLTSLWLVLELPAAVPIFLVLGGEFARRDYTGGEATRAYEQLRSRAAIAVRSASELMVGLVKRLPPD